MELKQAELDALHQRQLAIYKEIERLCIANNISYFAIAGTLLGAVRHRAFIPWDDDLDLGMNRENYNRFLACARDELGSDFFLQTWHTDPNFGLPMAKVRLNGTLLIESASAAVDCHQGIFVDIFPFDAKPDAPLRRFFHATSTYILKRIMLHRSGYAVGTASSAHTRWVFEALVRCMNGIPTHKIINIFEHQMMQFNEIPSRECVAVGGSYGYKRESILRQWIEDLALYEFEGMKLPGFAAYEQYLGNLYGNYREVPPTEERTNRHGIVAISFNDRYLK